MKIAFHTLGCKVNQYESEAMARIFREHGHEIVGEREYADVYVINTCTVTAVADKKSRQYIRRMKKVNPDSIVAVTGCYAQIKPEEVSAIQGVDIVTGTNEKRSLPTYVEQALAAKAERAASNGQAAKAEWAASNDQAAPIDQAAFGMHVRPYEELDSYEDTGIVTSAENRTRAYIKIQEGCNRFCAYCVIPYARGPVRSRDLGEIVIEARSLIEAGYKELVLTGINTALYGMEETESGSACLAGGEPCDKSGAVRKDKPYGVERVISAISEIEGDFRIRLSSLEPAVVNADYVRRLLKYEKLCHHLHLSAQSGSDAVLSAMNRPYDRSEYLKIVDAVRAFDPYYGISTDMIVGFPGEKEADHRDSVSLVEACDFCRTHVFRYSRRPKTKAPQMKGQVSPHVKARRADQLIEAGKTAALSFWGKNLGKKRRVLFEAYLGGEGLLTGYTDSYIRVYVRCSEAEAERRINTFSDVLLKEVYRDGALGLIL